MTPDPKLTTAVFFPPRIVRMDMTKGDSHEILNDVRDRYCIEGLVVLDEQGVTDAMKIIQYAAAFPRVCDPDWEQKQKEGLSSRVPVEQEQEHDMVNHPPHYTFGRFEVIDVIEDWKLDFHRANAVKYIARSRHKGSEVQDLEKAIWYLQRRVALLKTPPATS